jgi:hypothetical protein
VGSEMCIRDSYKSFYYLEMLKYPKVITVHYLEKLVREQEAKEIKTNQTKAHTMVFEQY